MKQWENKTLIILISITIAFFVCIALWTNNIARQNIGTDGFNTLFAPITAGIKNLSTNAGNFFQHFKDASKIINENAVLKEQNDELKKNATELDNYKKENERLRAILGLKDNYHKYKTVTGQIIANNLTNWQSEFTINIGTADGVKINSAVVSPKGLVGYISSVGTSWAVVKTILNGDVSVAGEVSRTGEATVSSGRVDLIQKNLCELTYVSKADTVITGDVIQTSGRGGIYPMGIIIGTIEEIITDENSATQTGIIQPEVNFSTLKEVVVIVK